MNIPSVPSGHAAIFGSMEKVALSSDLAVMGRLMSFDFASPAHCHVQWGEKKIINQASMAMSTVLLSAVIAQRHSVEEI